MKKRINGAIFALLAVAVVTLVGMDARISYASSGKDTATFSGDFGKCWVFQLMKSTWPSGPAPDPIWSVDNVQFRKGEMVLSIDQKDGQLTSGEVQTYKKYGYGMYQVRMKPIKHAGTVSAFFNYARNDETGEGTEIDIEFLGSDTTKVQFNYYTNGVGGHEYLYDLGFDASETYHDYAYMWTSDAIYWFVDGKLAYEVHAKDIPKLEAGIFMSVWAGGTKSWLGEFDRKTPLYAYYDNYSYTSLEDMNKNAK